MRIGNTAAIITAIVVISAAWAGTIHADVDGVSQITFDLNGGTLNGQGFFIETEGSLETGFPDVSGAVLPSGKNEFVVWSTSPNSYSQIYNVGDPVPLGITTFYAVWGVNLSTAVNVTISDAGCYIMTGGSGRNVTINSAGALLVMERAVIGDLAVSIDITILLRYAEDTNGNEIKSQMNRFTLASWGNPPTKNIVISKASTGTLNVTSGNDIWASNLRVDGGCLEVREINIGGTVVVNGTLKAVNQIYGGTGVEINGVAICDYIESNGPVTISGYVETNGKIQGSTIDISGDVTCGYVESNGPVTISGYVEADGKLQGSTITITGTADVGSIYTGGALTIDGNVNVEGHMQGTPTNVTGGTVIANSAWPNPNVTGTAVVIVGGQDFVPAGSEYIMIVPLSGFDTSNISDVLAKFRLNVDGTVLDVVLWLPEITDKISLGPNTSLVASGDGKYWMEVLYVLDGKEYVTTGEMIYQSSATPKYYLCEIGEGTEVDPGGDEDDLIIISRPSVYDSPVQIYVTPSMTTVWLVISGDELDIAFDSDEILISVPDDAVISGFWGTWGDLEEDPGGGYILMDEDFTDSGTFILFVIIPAPGPDAAYSVITPVCITTVPELSFDS